MSHPEEGPPFFHANLPDRVLCAPGIVAHPVKDYLGSIEIDPYASRSVSTILESNETDHMRVDS